MIFFIPGGQEGKAGTVACYACNDRKNLCHIWNIPFLLFFQHRAGIPQEVIQFQDLIPKFLRMNPDKHKHCREHLSWFTICLVNSITLSHTSQKRVWRETSSMQGHAHSMEWGVPDTCHTAQGAAKKGRTNRATSADQRQRLSPAQIITDSRSKVQCYRCSRV